MLRQAAFVLRPTRFVQTQLPRALSSSSHWVDVPLGPPDAILGGWRLYRLASIIFVLELPLFRYNTMYLPSVV